MNQHRFSSPWTRGLAAVTTAGVISAALVAGVPAQAGAAGGSGIATATITVGDKPRSSGTPVAPFGFALTSANEIFTFSLADPSRSSSQAITGIPAGSSVVGIDERPRTGVLYAVVKAANGNGSAYTINPATGVATKAFDLASIAGSVPGNSGPVNLAGNRYGVDFNPAADALRIIGDNGQNLRALPSDRNVTTGVVPNTVVTARLAGDTFTDLAINYPGAANPVKIDASAYTNNLTMTATTALFNVELGNSDLTLQNPPNNGTQVFVGDLALNDRPVSGFDIGTTGTVNTAYLATQNNSVPAKVTNPLEQALLALGIAQVRQYQAVNLSTVNLTTGALTSIGHFFTNTVIDIAVDTPAP